MPSIMETNILGIVRIEFFIAWGHTENALSLSASRTGIKTREIHLWRWRMVPRGDMDEKHSESGILEITAVRGVQASFYLVI